MSCAPLQSSKYRCTLQHTTGSWNVSPLSTFVVFNQLCLFKNASDWKPPSQTQHPFKPEDMKPWSLLCTVQGKFAKAHLTGHNYTQKHESKWTLHFSKEGYFCVVVFPSAAACSQRLAVSVWWCNSVTVLLQSSRNGQRHRFWVHFTPLKQRHPENSAEIVGTTSTQG